MSLATALLVVLACGCGSAPGLHSTDTGTIASPTTQPARLATATTTMTTRPPPVAVALAASVNGIPAARFIAIARAAARGYSEPHSWNIRVAVGSDHGAHALANRGGMTYNYGSTAPVYVLALDGYFRCDTQCADSGSLPATFGATPSTTATTLAPPIPASTMVLTLDLQTLHQDGNFELIDHPVLMHSLGTVWQLAP